MRRRRREAADNLNLSFLDAISCGFGAVILLLVITMLFEPASIQATREEALAVIAATCQERQAPLLLLDRDTAVAAAVAGFDISLVGAHQAVNAALEHVERVNDGAPITVFEVITAVAFHLFAATPADLCVLSLIHISEPTRPY